MKKIIYVLFAGILMTLWSCKKNALPTEETTQPEFYFNGEINGSPLSFSAGNDNYFMKSAYYQDSATHVYVYKAALTQTACTSCGYAISILINDTKVSAPSATMNVDNALKVGSYIYNDDNLEPLFYKASFVPQKNKEDGATYEWTIGDSVFSDTYKITDRILDANNLYNVTFKYSDASGSCSSALLNSFIPGSSLKTAIKATKIHAQSPFVYNFTNATTSKWAPVSYLWDFGDTESSSLANPGHTYKSLGKKLVKLRVIDAKQDTCIAYYHVDVEDSNPPCEANYSASFSPIPNVFGFSSITILITDPSGKVYSSKGFAQPDNSKFEIENINTYSLNERNEPTKKVKVRFNCALKNGNDQLTINNAEAVIAISYK